MSDRTSPDAAGPEVFPQARAIFEAALERPPAERARVVQEACGDDAALRAAVQQMLRADTTPHALLDGGPMLHADRWQAGESFADHYQIVALIGRGGMGEVYRAHDTRLGRDVALKVLPSAAFESASFDDRLARFQREAQVLAALNHPNIATIHGFETQGGLRALVLELVEGPTLADRIAAGPVPLDEAVPIARQIAVGLEAAHEQGVVHRDLKPVNIKLRPDGTVKLLDFGLAKVVQPGCVDEGVTTASPAAITSPSMIHAGVLLGTAAYMSPEQAKGREADRRSDVWAFGAVLYEMITGVRAFSGDDIAETLAAVLRADVDWSRLPTTTPPPLRHLLTRCLERDGARRLRDIGEARIVLEDLAGGARAVPSSGIVWSVQVPLRPLWRRAMPAVLAAMVTGALAGIAAWYLSLTPAPLVTRLSFNLPEGHSFPVGPPTGSSAISPDGAQLVYAGSSQGLFLRSMSRWDVKPIPGTERYRNLFNPVFSPDGRSVAFWALGDRTLKSIAVTGGAAVTICPVANNPNGISWEPEGIVFADRTGIMRVSPDGGTPAVLVRAKDGEAMQGPQLLPGGQHVLFMITTGTTPDRFEKEAHIVVQSLTSGERKTLIVGGYGARYLPTGHLVYALRGSLYAVAFDVRRLEVIGGPVPMVEGVRRSAGGAGFSVSNTGSLVYVAGPVSTSSGLVDIALSDREGNVERLELPPGEYRMPRMSPDGTRIAFWTDDVKQAIVWIYDVSRPAARRPLTFEGNNRFPIWSADGKRVAFQSDREGDLAIFWQPADGTGNAERLTNPDKGTSHVPESWSPNGDRFLYSVMNGSDASLWTYSLKVKAGTPFGAVHSSIPTGAVFSPNGRWVAYTSNERGTTTIYVQPFPATGERHQLAPNENSSSHGVIWSPDGKELFYNPRPDGFEAVSVTTEPTFAFGNPVAVPRSFQAAAPEQRRVYDITPNGKFLGLMPAGETGSRPTQIEVVLNWFEELRARVPAQ